MSTYTITDAPAQPVLGGGNSNVSLVNNGPSTIYLDDSTAVSPLNGMVLPPTGQMTWNSKTPLWAVCASGGTAQLVVNDSAGRVDASRAKFWSFLSSYNNVSVRAPADPYPSIDSISAECGHCETILLKLTVQSTQTVDPPTILLLPINWKDPIDNVIAEDDIYVTALPCMDPGISVYTIVIQLPVIGSIFSASIIQVAGVNNASVQSVQIFGSDRSLPYKWYCTKPVTGQAAVDDSRIILAQCRGFISGAKSSGDAVVYDFLSPALAQHIYIANLGKTLALTTQITAPTGNAGLARYEIRNHSGDVFGAQFIGSLGSGSVIDTYSEFVVPIKSALQIAAGGALNGSNLQLSITWKD